MVDIVNKLNIKINAIPITSSSVFVIRVQRGAHTLIKKQGLELILQKKPMPFYNHEYFWSFFHKLRNIVNRPMALLCHVEVPIIVG